MSVWPIHPRQQDNERQAVAGREIAAQILERVAEEHAQSHAVFVGWLQARRLLQPGETELCRFVPWQDRGL